MTLSKTTLGLVALMFSALIGWPDPSGREIMEQNKKLHQLQDEERVVEMQLIDRRNKVKKRSVHMLNMRTKDGLEKFMLVFLKPKDVNGTGLLTWEHQNRDDDQWLYLPSTKKEKRIASGGKKNRFMGTDFSYEDLAVENLDKHDYKLIDSQKYNGNDCYLVEASLKSKKDLKNSGYSKRVIWVRKDIHFSSKIDYYDKKGKHVKTLENGEPVNVLGTIYRSDTFIMTNLKGKRSTKMMVQERKFNQGLEEGMFSLRKLKSF